MPVSAVWHTRKLGAKMGRHHSSRPLTPSFRFMHWLSRYSCLQERSLHMPVAQAGASQPHPELLRCHGIDLSQRGSLSRGQKSRLPACAKAEVVLLVRKDSVAGRWEKGVFRSLFSDQPLSIPPAHKGKSRRHHHPTRPDTQGACWNQHFWSQQLHSVQCALHPLSFARAQRLSGLSLEKPLPGKSGPPPVSQTQGPLGPRMLHFHSRHLLSV